MGGDGPGKLAQERTRAARDRALAGARGGCRAMAPGNPQQLFLAPTLGDAKCQVRVSQPVLGGGGQGDGALKDPQQASHAEMTRGTGNSVPNGSGVWPRGSSFLASVLGALPL